MSWLHNIFAALADEIFILVQYPDNKLFMTTTTIDSINTINNATTATTNHYY